MPIADVNLINAGGAKRLEIARKLMRWPGEIDVLAKIRALPEKDRQHLKGLTDWVEEYERYEHRQTQV